MTKIYTSDYVDLRTMEVVNRESRTARRILKFIAEGDTVREAVYKSVTKGTNPEIIEALVEKYERSFK